MAIFRRGYRGSWWRLGEVFWFGFWNLTSGERDSRGDCQKSDRQTTTINFIKKFPQVDNFQKHRQMVLVKSRNFTRENFLKKSEISAKLFNNY